MPLERPFFWCVFVIKVTFILDRYFLCTYFKSIISVSSLCPESTWITTPPSRWMKETRTERPGSETRRTKALTWKSGMIPPKQASSPKWIIPQIQLDVFQTSSFTNSALCFVSAEEKADPSIPLYVLPLYSLLAPEQQAKVRLMSYVSTKLITTTNVQAFVLYRSTYFSVS